MLKKPLLLIAVIAVAIVLLILCYVIWVYEVKAPERTETKVELYFGNKVNNPQALDYSQVFLVERIIPKQPSLLAATLQALLDGPTPAEKQAGFFTSLNSGIKVQQVELKGDTVLVDFDDSLELGVGGSCRVTAIRSQINKTLKQFPNIKKVVISINGRTDDILQP